MKILLVNRIAQMIGGADKYFREMERILGGRGHSVDTFTAWCPGDPGSPESAGRPGSFHERTEPAPSLGGKIRFFFNGIYSKEARRLLGLRLEAQRPDVAHLVNIFFQLSTSVIDELHERGIPVVFQMNDYQLLCSNAYLYRDGRICTDCSGRRFLPGLLHRCYRGSWPASLMAYAAKRVAVARKTLSKVDSFVVPTAAMADLLRELGLGDARFDVVQNPFDPAGLSVRECWGPHIVFYGRLIRQKGIYTLLEAVRRLGDVPLKIFGNGPEAEGVAAFIREHALTQVHLDTALRWGPELQEAVGGARLVVAPSEWHVPAEYVVYEAFALGRAVVGADIGGNRALVEEGVTGRLFKPGDPGDLARVLRELYPDLALIRRLGMNGRARIESGYTEDRYHAGVMALYADLIDKGGGRNRDAIVPASTRRDHV